MAKAMTAKQRAALRKAQLASAAKRRGRGKGRPAPKGRKRGSGKGISTSTKVAVAAGAVAVGVGVAYAAHSVRKNDKKSKLKAKTKASNKMRSDARKRLEDKAILRGVVRNHQQRRKSGTSNEYDQHSAAMAKSGLRYRSSRKVVARKKAIKKARKTIRSGR